MKNQNSDALFGEILVLLQRLRAEDMLTETSTSPRFTSPSCSSAHRSRQRQRSKS